MAQTQEIVTRFAFFLTSVHTKSIRRQPHHSLPLCLLGPLLILLRLLEQPEVADEVRQDLLHSSASDVLPPSPGPLPRQTPTPDPHLSPPREGASAGPRSGLRTDIPRCHTLCGDPIRVRGMVGAVRYA